MANEPIERDVETLIDLQLRKLGWEDNPKSYNRNVYKQQPKTETEKSALNGLKPDYVLYSDGQPLAIIEAKRPNREIDKALIQGLNYAKLINAPIVIATNGISIKTIHAKYNEPLIIDGDEVSTFLKENTLIKFKNECSLCSISPIVIKSRTQLIDIFKQADNLLRKEGLTKGAERFSVFSNILFLKLMSEIQELKIENGEIDTIPRDFLWDSFRKKRGQELLSYINDTVLKAFDTYYRNGSDSIFEKLNIKNPNVLSEIINELNPLYLTNIDSDIKGDAFEYFLKTYNAGEKDLGEYFTPRHIVKFMVQLLNPQFGETIYDPFCGTGGMLIECFKHLVRIAPNNTKSTMNILQSHSLYGREISSTAKIAKMNMILMGDGHNNIKKTDSLEHPVNGLYDAVITNMPFSQETDFGLLYDIPSSDANSICIQHCIKAINPQSKNGRVVLIVPEKVLFDKSYSLLRKSIYDSCTVENVISLPTGAFQPYTSVKTDILVLKNINKKLAVNKTNFYFIKNDGYTLDQYRKKLSGINDFDRYITSDNEKNTLVVEANKIKQNNYILQGRKYLSKLQYAKSIFNTNDFYKLSEFLIPVKKEKITLIDTETYKILGVSSEGKGLTTSIKSGEELKSQTKYYQAQPNCLLWCTVDTKKGAFAVIPEKGYERCIISGNRTLLQIDTRKYLPEFLQRYFTLTEVQEYFDNYLSGSTNRQYIKKDEILDLYFPKIEIEIQKELVDNLKKYEAEIHTINKKIISHIPTIFN